MEGEGIFYSTILGNFLSRVGSSSGPERLLWNNSLWLGSYTSRFDRVFRLVRSKLGNNEVENERKTKAKYGQCVAINSHV